ncbi:cytochrome P450 [Lentinula raphanica]|nr:cytochrome P450 [Lentinula raphanica]
MTPPGLALLFRLVLPQIFCTLCVYVAFEALENRWGTYSATARYSIFLCAFLLRPFWIIFLARPCTTIFNAYRASVKGAILPPLVEGSSSEVIASVMRSFGDGYIGEGYLDWARKYGNTYLYQAYNETRFLTIEPEYIKAILATQFNEFEKGLVNYEQLKSLLGSGVFNSDGEMWRFHRNMTRPFFSKTRISDFDIFERHTDDIISAMKRRLGEGYPVEFQDAIGRFTLDSATEYLFGKDVGSIGAGLPYPKHVSKTIKTDELLLDHPSNVFVRAFTQGMELVALRGRRGHLWPLKEFWSDQVSIHREEVDKFTNPILKERKRQHLARSTRTTEKEKDEDGDGEGETFLDHLIRSTEDEQIIRDELVNILVAGRDTTASLLTFAIYVLTQTPAITQRLRKEILDSVGPHARPTYKNIADMKYLRAFLNGVLALRF